jgi:hypothetical protein
VSVARRAGKPAYNPAFLGAHPLARAPRAGNDDRTVESSHARAIAERLLSGIREPGGSPLLAHVRRVAAAAPPEARAVAWLHELLETGAVSEQELLADGLSSDELRALRLLTRPGRSHSDVAYLAHLELIALAAGHSGELARLVKLADLEDRQRHPVVRSDGWAPPYARGHRRLMQAA